MDLLLCTSTHADHAVVRVSGEVDLQTAPQLIEHVSAALRDHGGEIMLDLSEVTFMDSTGLKTLLTIRQRAELVGGSLGLVGVTRPVMRVMTVTGLVAAFAFFDDVETGVARDRSKSPAD